MMPRRPDQCETGLIQPYFSGQDSAAGCKRGNVINPVSSDHLYVRTGVDRSYIFFHSGHGIYKSHTALYFHKHGIDPAFRRCGIHGVTGQEIFMKNYFHDATS
jgi:hypothetical protein